MNQRPQKQRAYSLRSSQEAGWVISFSPETWDKFTANGSLIGAFSLSRRAAAERIRVGDLLFSYISGLQCISGVFKAESLCFQDDSISPYGNRSRFVLLIKLRPLADPGIDKFIAIDSLAGKMQIFRGINRKNFYHAFRISPRSIPSADRDFLLSQLIA